MSVFPLHPEKAWFTRSLVVEKILRVSGSKDMLSGNFWFPKLCTYCLYQQTYSIIGQVVNNLFCGPCSLCHNYLNSASVVIKQHSQYMISDLQTQEADQD